ncbi:hypothetical protein [Bradyrhizobium sp. G127]|jgi:hypothetical protein|nr:hypothetical protein [Bradyrhizobium sp. G127]MCF2521387.1 hypothetical protein [Bradyrhizobium sp. G127]
MKHRAYDFPLAAGDDSGDPVVDRASNPPQQDRRSDAVTGRDRAGRSGMK